MSKTVGVLFIYFFFMFHSFPGSAKDLYIAAASNFATPMHSLIERFEQETGHTVTLSIASSGKLYAQITKGAPFEVFFSADQAMPNKLVNNDLALSSSQFTYAIGVLALWSNNSNIKDPKTALLNADYHRLAIANPKLAPFGQAAEQVLRSLNIGQLDNMPFVKGENVSQVFQFVLSGNADLGFVSLSQLIASEQRNSNRQYMNAVWVVPDELHSVIYQDAVITKRGADNPLASAFMLFMKSHEAQQIIESFGYDIPEKQKGKR